MGPQEREPAAGGRLVNEGDVARFRQPHPCQEHGQEHVGERVQAEHALTRDRVLALSGAGGLCARFPGFRRRFDRVRPMIDQTNRWQVDLLKDARAGRHKDKALTPLLMTMNCIASGLGWTG